MPQGKRFSKHLALERYLVLLICSLKLKRLLTKHLRYTEGQIAACGHYLEIILHHIVYGFMAGDLNLLKRGVPKWLARNLPSPRYSL